MKKYNGRPNFISYVYVYTYFKNSVDQITIQNVSNLLDNMKSL